MFSGERSEPTSFDGLIGRMERGEFDLLSVGRAPIVQADWAAKVKAGQFDVLAPFERTALATFL